MKSILATIIATLFLTAAAQAAQGIRVTGRVTNSRNEAVGYATVLLLDGTRQAAGTATDSLGRFTLEVVPGSYTLQLLCLGYETLKREMRIDAPTDTGPIELREEATRIDDVVVRARMVRREADRYVMEVANSPASIGKDGIELLESAPGIWIDDKSISINGREGTTVYVNGRQLRLSGEQLNSYLRSLRAEEILRVEIIPVAGADSDASSPGGIVRITLRQRRERGTQGTASLTAHAGALERTLVPRMRLNRHSGDLDLYGEACVPFVRSDRTTDEQTLYSASEALLNARSETRTDEVSLKGQLGAVYQIAPQHSIGLEAEYLRDRETGPTLSCTDLRNQASALRTQSRYDTYSTDNRYSMAFNYIWNIDSLGSTLKLLVDHNRRSSTGGSDNSCRTLAADLLRDSLYRDRSEIRYDVSTATLAWDGSLSKRLTLRAGAKYVRNGMRNDDRCEYLRGETWIPDLKTSSATDYVERIAAAYGILAFRSGRWSAVAGLRAEYTDTRGRNAPVEKHYLSLFPNANLSCALGGEEECSLVLQYGRTIERPGFRALNPRREQFSEYSYQTGNPDLAPAFRHDISLTCVLAGKYTLTCGAMILTDEIQQIARADEEHGDLLNFTWINFAASHNCYASASIPLQPARWLQANAHAVWLRSEQHIPDMGIDTRHDCLFASLSATFSLPAKWYVDLSYRYQSRTELGNCWVEPVHLLNAGIKKRIGERLTLSLTARNLLDRKHLIGARSDGFVRRVAINQQWHRLHCRFSLSYAFSSGKSFRQRSVEAGSAQEKGRM